MHSPATFAELIEKLNSTFSLHSTKMSIQSEPYSGKHKEISDQESTIFQPVQQAEMPSHQMIVSSSIPRASGKIVSEFAGVNATEVVFPPQAKLQFWKPVAIDLDLFSYLRQKAGCSKTSASIRVRWGCLPISLTAPMSLPDDFLLDEHNLWHLKKGRSTLVTTLLGAVSKRDILSSSHETFKDALVHLFQQFLRLSSKEISSGKHLVDRCFVEETCKSHYMQTEKQQFDWNTDCSYERPALKRTTEVHSRTRIYHRQSTVLASRGTSAAHVAEDSSSPGNRNTYHASLAKGTYCKEKEQETTGGFERDDLLDFDEGHVAYRDLLSTDVAQGLRAFIGLQRDVAEKDTPASQLPIQARSQGISITKSAGSKPKPKFAVASTSAPLSKLDLDLAQECLVAGHSFVLLPPPLCALAAVLCLANSYLLEQHFHHRCLLLCIGLPKELEQSVFDYSNAFLSSNSKQVKLATRAKGYSTSPAPGMIVAPGIGCIGQQDLAVPFSYVAILLHASVRLEQSAHFGNISAAEQEMLTGICKAASTVVCAQYPANVDFVGVAAWLRGARHVVQFDRVISRNPLVDAAVRSRIALSSPSSVFVVLPAAAQEAVQAIEEAAFPLLRSTVDSELEQPVSLMALETYVIHRLMESFRSRKNSREATRRLQNIVIVNTLKRALTFCLNDSIRKGADFAAQAASRFPNALLSSCASRLKSIDASYTDTESHYRVDRVCTLVRTELQAMEDECRATRSSRLQKSWRALVIADSSKAVDDLLVALDGAVEVEYVEPGLKSDSGSKAALFVAHLDQLTTSPSSHLAAVKYFSQFSHVVLLATVSTTESIGNTAPVALLQLSHAGCLRMITIQIDVEKKLEVATKESERVFKKFCLALGKAEENGSNVDRVLEVLDQLFLGTRETETGNSQVPTTSVRHIDIAIGILARHPCDWIAGTLFTKLREIYASRSGFPSDSPSKLLVAVLVPANMGTHVACERLHQAICSHRYLLDRVEVSYIFDDAQHGGDMELFKPRKRQRTGDFS
jgi:hypothetical protein